MNQICVEIAEIANKELDDLVNKLPSDPALSFVMFFETLRVYDYNGIGESAAGRLDMPDLYLMRMGWNLCSSYLFKDIGTKGFPLMESTRETRLFALSLLHSFGRILMLRRVIDMIKSGLMSVRKVDSKFIFTKNEMVDSQFIDKLSLPKLEELEQEIVKATEFKKWNVVPNNLSEIINYPGCYIGLPEPKEINNELEEKIKADMLHELFPWDSGRGIMLGYNTTEDIDYFFIVKAWDVVNDWRTDAGIHPSTNFGKFDGAELTGVVVILTSIYLKHVRYAFLSPSKYPEISIPQSLTTWKPFDEFKENISNFMNIEVQKVSDILDALALKIDDIHFLRENTSIFMPLLIDMNNGYIINPVASVLINPFYSIINLFEYRNPQLSLSIAQHREEWLRTQIYSLFLGVRYIRVVGNVNIKEGGKIITDIDAAVYDRTTGQLAIIQIKWQDFHINDVKRLRSKASNLCKSLDDWADRVDKWIVTNGLEELSRTLRLGKGAKISSYYLFGISKYLSNTQGYGFQTRYPTIAIANMAQFTKSRFELGPNENVIQNLHKELQSNSEVIETTPLPYDFTISNFHFHFEDLFCTYGENTK